MKFDSINSAMIVLLSDNINEYVIALAPFMDAIHVVDNAQRVPVLKKGNVFGVRKEDFSDSGFLSRYLTSTQTKVIYTQGYQSLKRVSKAIRIGRRAYNIITTCHNGYVWQSKIKSFIFIVSAAMQSDGIIFLARRDFYKWKWLCRICSLPAWHLPNPVDLSRFPQKRHKRASSSIVLGNVGGVLQAKGQIVAVKALQKLLNDNYDIKLKFVGAIGDSKYKNMIDRWVKKNGLENNVEWLGELSYSKVPEFLQSIDIFICPSYCEVSPFCILEAMASHLPIVASDVGGIPDMVFDNQNGFVFKAGNDKELATSIRQIIDNNLFEQFGERSRELVQLYFSCQVIGSSLRDVLFEN